jgi:hypothetical protein
MRVCFRRSIRESVVNRAGQDRAWCIFPAGIAERDIQPFDAGRHFERDQDVAVLLLVVDGAVEIEILSVKGETEEEKQKATKME